MHPTLINELKNLQSPYWSTACTEPFPGYDLNKEIIKPGKHEEFPDGAVLIRADGDFWVVAALPNIFELHTVTELAEILWPNLADKFIYTPDHGTIEQKVYFLKRENEYLESLRKSLEKRRRELEDEVRRLRRERPDKFFPAKARTDSIKWMSQEYTTLLKAVAHKHKPWEVKPGICMECGLLADDRVHMDYYINAVLTKEDLFPAITLDERSEEDD